MRRLISAALACLTLVMSGCAIVELGVRNPVPGLETVAIVPFFNLSQDRTVDGREFALAYYSELQKVPGFEVLPVGVTERAIFENQLDMTGPEDALTLAKILDVDAVVVGAVTDFDAYNPRIGLKISWYSPQQWLVLPNSPTRRKLFPSLARRSDQKVPGASLTMRAQSPDSFVVPDDQWTSASSGNDDTPAAVTASGPDESHWNASPRESRNVQAQAQAPREFQPPIQARPLPADPQFQDSNDSGAVELLPAPRRTAQAPLLPKDTARPALPLQPETASVPNPPAAMSPVANDPFSDEATSADRMLIPRRREQRQDNAQRTIPALVYDEQIVTPQTDGDFDPHEPLMAYVRIFDSTDRRLVARLADYLELSGESRSGDLEAWMQRTEFFRKFTAHVMISEMLALHGGESRRRLVLKPREYR